MSGGDGDNNSLAMPWWRRVGARPEAAMLGGILLVLLALRFSPVSISPHEALGIKIFILAGAVLLVVLWRQLPRKARLALLVVLAVIAALNYYRWGPRSFYEKVDVYDVVHYYLGAKYFEELGHEGLYPALILADRENGPKSDKLKRYRLQTGDGYEYRGIDDALERGRELRRTHFTSERWQSFEQDSLVLLRDIGLSSAGWRKVVGDRGFNGSPAWVASARPFVALVPAQSVKFLCLLDVILLASALFAIRHAYGGEIALWALIFLAASYSMRWPVAGEALFRYVWLAALLWALALVKMGRPITAGAALAVSFLMRIFPVVWLFGPAAQMLQQFDRRPFRLRNIERHYWLMAAGFAGVVIMAVGWIVLDIGVGALVDHARDMRIHIQVEQLVSRHIGLAKALVFEGGLEPKNLTAEGRAAIGALKPVTGFLALCLLIALALGVRTLPRDQAFALGFIPFFLLATAHDYHGVARVTLIVYHAARLENRWDRICLVWLLALELFASWATVSYPDHIAFRIGYLAWGTAIYVLLVTIFLARDWWRARPAAGPVSVKEPEIP
jgi:hypothetical protein